MKFEYIKSKEQLEKIFKDLPDLRVEFEEKIGYLIRSTATNIKEDGTFEKVAFPTHEIAYIASDFEVKLFDDNETLSKWMNKRLHNALVRQNGYTTKWFKYIDADYNRRYEKIDQERKKLKAWYNSKTDEIHQAIIDTIGTIYNDDESE